MNGRTNPFPGLRPFRSDEDYLFFGREGQNDALLRLLRQSRFVAIVGVSGSGKSSLVRAGLLPALVGGLMAGVGSRWRIAMLRPGSDPIANLAHALLHPELLVRDDEITEATDTEYDPSMVREAAIRAQLVEASLLRGGLGLVEASVQLQLAGGEKLLVVVDQFEELFRYAGTIATGASDRSRGSSSSADEGYTTAFVRLLLEASQSPLAPIYVIITMRSDFLGDCAQFRDLPEAINGGQYLIPRMTRDQRRRAIEGPVAVGGATITPRLVQRLLNDVGDSPDQLPILQHALMRTWELWRSAADPATPLDLLHYTATGGMEQALSNHADEIYHNLPDKRSRELAKQIFKGLTQLGHDNRGVRRPATLAQLRTLTGAGADEVSAALAPFRRPDCAFIAPPETAPLTPDTTIDISHESLMRIWQRLERWVAEEAQDALWLRRLSDAAQLHEQGEASLWRDPELALALEWQTAKAPTAAWAQRYIANFDAAMNFLDVSHAAQLDEERHSAEADRVLEEARQRELESERRRAAESEAYARRLGWLVAGLALAVLVAGLVAWIAIQQSILASAHTLVAEARHQPDLQLATLLALEAKAISYEEDEANRLLTHDLLARKLLINVSSIQEFKGHSGGVTSVAWSPDGRLLASASDDRTIKLWGVATGEILATLTGHAGGVTSVAWSPDGQTLASASDDRTVMLWGVATDERPIILTGHTDSVTSVAWNPDGQTLASAADDGAIIVWDTATGNILTTFQGHVLLGDPLVVWSPDSQTLASAASWYDTIDLWDMMLGTSLPALQDPTGNITSISWSPDGRILASSADDYTIKLWDTTTREILDTFQGHTDKISSVAWNPNGQIMASASDDYTIKLWDVATGESLETIQVSFKSTTVAWSPNGQILAAASRDDTIDLWAVTSAKGLITLQGHTDSVTSVAWSPDGQTLVSASNDRTIKVWDPVKGESLDTLQDFVSIENVAWSPEDRILASTAGNHAIELWDMVTAEHLDTWLNQSSVTSVVWSPDGQTLAAISWENTVELWDVTTGKVRTTLQGHIDTVTSVAWSPDGRLLASASEDNTIRLWDVATGETEDTFEISYWATKVAWSPDGQILAATATDNTIDLWAIATGEILTVLQGHTDSVTSVAWSPDVQILASASVDRTIKLWDAMTGELLTTLQGHTDSVTSVAWSPDGQTLASASVDRAVKLWPIALIRNPCTLVYANFSLDEWLSYRGWTIYHPTCSARLMPSMPNIRDALRSANLNLLMITWLGRFVVALGMLVPLIVVFGFAWIFARLYSWPRTIFVFTAVSMIGFVLIWLDYYPAILYTPPISFEPKVSLPMWQLVLWSIASYLWLMATVLILIMLLWGVYKMMCAGWRAVFAVIVVLLVEAGAYVVDTPLTTNMPLISNIVLVAAIGFIVAMLLWGLYGVMYWLYRALQHSSGHQQNPP